jgi:hypothetical protein
VEVNTLEDAYINIAKEEDRLLRKLKQDGMQRFSEVQRQQQKGLMAPKRSTKLNESEHEVENDTTQKEVRDLQRYKSIKPHSTFKTQLWAQIRRRVTSYFNNPKEIYLSMYPFILPMMYTIILLMVITNIPDLDADTESSIISTVFPILISIGILTSSGIFVHAPVVDREDKLRYLLNFAGMRSSSYFIGFLIGDLLVFVIPQLLLIIMVFVLQLTQFQDHMVAFFTSVFVFSLPFISMIYVFSFMFDKAESAFKYVVLLVLIQYALPSLATINVTAPSVGYAMDALFPSHCFNSNMSQILSTGVNWEIYMRLAFMFGQCAFFMALSIMIDTRNIHKFRGKDGNIQTQNRTQLDERPDVVAHRQ